MSMVFIYVHPEADRDKDWKAGQTGKGGGEVQEGKAANQGWLSLAGGVDGAKSHREALGNGVEHVPQR